VYDLGVNSEYQQSLDSIAIAMRQNPIDTKNPDMEDQSLAGGGEETPPEEEEAPEPEPTGPNPKQS